MNDILFLVLVIIVALVALLLVPRWLVSRAAKKVVRIFQDHGAVNEKNARTADELGLTPPGFLQRMARTRNYKPQALNILINAEIVQITEDGRLYLVEDRLASTRLGQR